MLAAKDRLDSHAVEEVFKKGQRKNRANFSVVFLLGKEKQRFAVSVSKKIAKSAVTRNKIKRRIYSVLRGIKKDLPQVWVAIVPKTGILVISFEDLKKELAETFSDILRKL